MGGDHVRHFSISPEVLLSPSIEDCREVESRGTNWGSHVLDGGDYKSESEEHGSSIEEQLSCKASGSANTFEEVEEFLDHHCQCYVEISEAFVDHCSGVPPAAITKVIAAVHDHLREPLINGESLNTQDSRVLDENERDLIKAGTVESQVEPAARDGMSWQDDFNGRISGIQKFITKSVQYDLEQRSVPGGLQNVTLQRLVIESQHPGAKLPELSQLNERQFQQ